MTVVLLTGPKKIEIAEVKRPTIKDNEILCKTLYTSISPGTYLQRYLGIQPNLKSYPFIPGYLNVSKVVEVGKSLRNRRIKEGDIINVHSFVKENSYYTNYNGTDSEYVVVSESSLPYIVKIKQNPRHLALTVMGHVGFGTAIETECNPSKTTLVIGQGILGLGCTRAFALAGAKKIVAVDLFSKRLKVARKLGATHTELGGEHTFEIIKKKYPEGFDIVVEATGNSKMLKNIFAFSKSGDVFLVSLYPKEAPIILGDFRHHRLIGLLRSNVVIPMVYHLLDAGLFMIDEIISDIIPPEELEWAYQALLNEPAEHLGILVDWTGSVKNRQRIW